MEKNDNSAQLDVKNINKIKQQLEKNKSDIIDTENKLYSLTNSMKQKQKFTGTAYITFETPEQSRLVKKHFELGTYEKFLIYLKDKAQIPSDKLFKGNFLTVKRAPEPDDILWENHGIDYFIKLKKRLITSAATLLLLVGSFVFILIISYLQRFFKKLF